MTLSYYWPNQNEIENCITSEAETNSDAMLLAVHQKMQLERKLIGNDTEVPTKISEEVFLADFLKGSTQGSLIMPVTGASGVGKSHLVGWLHAQLNKMKAQNDPRVEKLTIIRIPKSASLRNVVELILGPLEQNPQFDDIREQLKTATSEVTPFLAAERFQTGLRITFKNLERKLWAELKELNSTDPVKNRLEIETKGKQIYHAKNLPYYLAAPEFEEHFSKDVDKKTGECGVLTKIIMAAIEGLGDDEDREENRSFKVEDLYIPESELPDTSGNIKNFYGYLQKDNGQGFHEAVDLLNTVIGEAIGEVYQFQQATGGKSLEELILDIRKILLTEQKELVFLIEDFYVLSGIQEQLLKVCVQNDSERGGKKLRSPIRTVLAVTPGYLDNFSTSQTRANEEYWVLSDLDNNEDTFQATENLIGSYLNAARWGREKIENHFSENNLSHSPDAQLPVFTDPDIGKADQEVLNTFEKSENNIPLFPFNKMAIREMCALRLNEGGQIKFLPRFIIRRIIEPILGFRNLYEEHKFPPADLFNVSPKADVTSWLYENIKNEEVRDRASSLITFWLGNPDNIKALSLLPQGYLKAFNLDFSSVSIPLENDHNENTDREQNEVEKKVRDEVKDEDNITEDTAKYINAPEDIFEKWGSGQQEMPQEQARELRNIIRRLLLNSMDWLSRNTQKSKRQNNIFISIPNSKGEGRAGESTNKIIIDIVTEKKDAKLRKAFSALWRYEYNKAYYPKQSDDYVAVLSFIDELRTQYLDIINLEAENDIIYLVGKIGVQATILDIDPKHKFHETVEDLTVETSHQGHVGITKWVELRQSANANRTALVRLLHEQVGAYQGNTGQQLFAFDKLRLNRVLSKEKDIDPTKLLDVSLNDELKEHIKLLSKLRVEGVCKSTAKVIVPMLDNLAKYLGENFNQRNFYDEAILLGDELQKIDGGYPEEFSFLEMSQELEWFSSLKISMFKKIMDVLQSIDVENEPYGNILKYLTKINVNDLERLERFLIRWDKFLTVAQTNIERASESLDLDPKESEIEFKNILNKTLNNLKDISNVSESIE